MHVGKDVLAAEFLKHYIEEKPLNIANYWLNKIENNIFEEDICYLVDEVEYQYYYDYEPLEEEYHYQSDSKVITIPLGEKITHDYFYGREKIETVIIDSDFDFVDSDSPFSSLTNLKEFVVEGSSPFFTKDGVLFYDIKRGGRDKMFLRLLDEDRKYDGTILIAFPINHKSKNYSIPNHVQVISSYAFCNSHIESAFLPDSIKLFGSLPFKNTPNLKRIFVPNKMIDFMCYLSSDDNKLEWEVLPNKKDKKVAPRIKHFWKELRLIWGDI